MVERCPDKTEVLGPIPSTRTRLTAFYFMENNERKNPWWRDGMIVFIKVSGYITFPLIIASYLGKFLDEKYNTGNLVFFILITISFFSTIFLIAREAKIYKKKIEKDEKSEKKI